jgi:catalase
MQKKTRTKPSKPAGTKPSSRPDLDAFRITDAGAELTTNQGVRIADDQNSLRAGERGPTLLEDFILREKITHFDHERIPERVVHARGAGAHGYFELYESLEDYTRARFLCEPGVKTPVFARFSTVGGSRGSADTVRDVRGFAVKFYTAEGNYDLVGNNMPVFFIQDAIKFPDFVHAVKPEPHNEIPQASSAHDTFWDFVSLTPESTHMVMWLMSDRALPRSLGMMEGFGVHTYRLVNAAGDATFVKFHWKPLAGAHALVWDEAQKLAGKDADFNRRDMWESIERGDFFEWELGVQLFSEDEADRFDFDILDPTKLVPEELVPVQRVGKMVLDRNPDNYFAETEQVAFCVSHVVPGIDFSNDPLLQGRIFSYLDTQLSRLGGPNFHQIPINRPICPFKNNQRDGIHQMGIPTSPTSYDPNSVGGDVPKEVRVEAGGFASYLEQLEGDKRRVRADSFKDHFSQATLFWNSQSDVEKEHIIGAFSFELTKVERPAIRERQLGILARVDATLAARVAENLGLAAPAAAPSGQNGSSGARGKKNGKTKAPLGLQRSAALSMMDQPGSAKGRAVAILAAPGVDAKAVASVTKALVDGGAHFKVIAPRLGALGLNGKALAADGTILTMPSIVFDAIYVPGGADSVAALSGSGDALHFIAEAYKHAKPIAASGEGLDLLERAGVADGPGVFVGDPADVASALVEALGRHRVWERDAAAVLVPA